MPNQDYDAAEHDENQPTRNFGVGMVTRFIVIDLAAGVAKGITNPITEKKSNYGEQATYVLDPTHKSSFDHRMMNLV